MRVSAEDLERRLVNLDSSRVMVVMTFHRRHLGTVLALHLAIFFDAILESGNFPFNLKPVFLVPIQKSRGNLNVKNYTLIVIQPSVATVFEGLVLDVGLLSFAFKGSLNP